MDRSKHAANASVGRVSRRRVELGMGCQGRHDVHIDWTREANTSGVRSRAAARSLLVACRARPPRVSQGARSTIGRVDGMVLVSTAVTSGARDLLMSERRPSVSRSQPSELTLQRIDLRKVAAGVVVAASLSAVGIGSPGARIRHRRRLRTGE